MTTCRGVRLLALGGALCVALAGCAGTTRYTGLPGRAAVVWEPAREADAAAARRVLEERGWSVDAAPAGPASRTRSSLALYGQRRRPGHGADLAGALEPVVGEVEVLPFLADGPGRHDAVLWLR
jgi:hypothetical protein